MQAEILPSSSSVDLLTRFKQVRGETMARAAPLSAEDACVQSMPDASPVKWHLAHTSWFFETFILERFEKGFAPWRAEFRVLFNSYYNGIGQKHPRAQRGLLTRPALHEVDAYRRDIDTRMEKLVATIADTDLPALTSLLELGLQHEQQHQELMLTDIKHLLSLNPLAPAYAAPGVDASHAARAPLEWLECAGGLVDIGHTGTGFCFDNELPRHRQFLEPFQLASRLVSNGEYAAFIASGGYRNPALWLSEGWDWVQANGLTQPLYWSPTEDGWQVFTLHGAQALEPAAAAVHLSYYEADAYARWAGARLPTEAEWEYSACGQGEQGGLVQLFDTAWQWTSSSYAPYAGYRAPEGAIGEYNGKFMVNQYVLRGASRVTPAGHARASYRNFFPAAARWQYSGIRLARACAD